MMARKRIVSYSHAAAFAQIHDITVVIGPRGGASLSKPVLVIRKVSERPEAIAAETRP